MHTTTMSTTFTTSIEELDFNRSDLAAGTTITSQFAGITISTDTAFGAMLFDTDNPTGGDFDLAASGIGNVLIISEDGDAADPDDNAAGGTIRFDWDGLVDITTIDLLDIDEAGGLITFYGENGNVLATRVIPDGGNNNLQAIALEIEEVAAMDVFLIGSGAIANIDYSESNSISLPQPHQPSASTPSSQTNSNPQSASSPQPIFRTNSNPQPASISEPADESPNLNPLETPQNATAQTQIDTEFFPSEQPGRFGTPLSPIDFTSNKVGVTTYGTPVRDGLNGTYRSDTIRGKRGQDQLIGGRRGANFGKDQIFGHSGKDLLHGGKGSDYINGGRGKDKLVGGDNRDQLIGRNGDDILLGQKGRDILIGGRGNDRIIGGSGKDMFVYKKLRDGTDQLIGFNPKQDVIDLRPIFSRSAFAGDSDWQRFTDLVDLVEVNGSTQIRVDKDGYGSGIETVTLAVTRNVVGLTSENFVIS